VAESEQHRVNTEMLDRLRAAQRSASYTTDLEGNRTDPSSAAAPGTPPTPADDEGEAFAAHLRSKFGWKSGGSVL
jgi:hypothetical protein